MTSGPQGTQDGLGQEGGGGALGHRDAHLIKKKFRSHMIWQEYHRSHVFFSVYYIGRHMIQCILISDVDFKSLVKMASAELLRRDFALYWGWRAGRRETEPM